jgi:O-antigen/teichoic acid export membrane protein
VVLGEAAFVSLVVWGVVVLGEAAFVSLVVWGVVALGEAVVFLLVLLGWLCPKKCLHSLPNRRRYHIYYIILFHWTDRLARSASKLMSSWTLTSCNSLRWASHAVQSCTT